ncbi:AP2 domain-containing protein [Cryptosporidium muris RN66]|uniref:AP2 domain-containing protein n=1 Tax=Cryptosporidium muris (strain RN66) TaxID=441375 RepID=B6AEI2_CRYMR|nr:AP2 domain-containing protein [Cryptosporidium muris RN66]EEA06599.1 AP2 domain-containing protein [Cryptosporidium muris RN66]|eukprot:XP_002140948.1 AP2 domain-containing protein [Cryptosporidium muris RN66]
MSNSSNSFHPQSGHPGVTWCSERRTWRICYAPEPGKRVTKSFNPRHYGGLEQARQAAVEYLREQKAKLSLYKPSGGNGSNSSKSENSSVNLKKMNDMRHPTTSAIDVNVNNINSSNSNKLMKSSNGNSKWSSTYNGFEFSLSHCNNNNMGISNENNSDGKINVNGTNNHLFGIENTSNEQWNVAAAAVIAHAINTSKNSGFSQKRKSIYEHSSSLGVPSNKSSKSSNTHNGMYEDNLMYFNSHINNNNHCIEGQNYCECCYSPSQYKHRQTLQSCQYSCSHICSESNCNSNYKVSSIPISNNHPFICEGNDPNSVNDLMNIRTPKYVSYQRHSTNNQEEDSLHPSIASSSPLGRMFQSTPYQNLDNYDNVLTPYMRINQSIGQNGTNNRFNTNSYENNECNPTGCNLNTNSNSLLSNSNQSMTSSGNYPCYNLNSNYVNDQSNDIHSPYSCWFEGLGSCYSEIEDTFLSKTNSNNNLHLPPIGSLGPYSFQPFKEYSSNDNGNKSIVESVLLPLSITTCSTSAEPQLSNELLIEPYRGTSTFPNSTDK